MFVPLELTITRDFTISGSSGATDADSLPTCKVFEDSTDTAILTPTVVKRSGETGVYRVSIPCTSVNGFEAGKSYNVLITAVVGGVTTKATISTFLCWVNSFDSLATLLSTVNSAVQAITTQGALVRLSVPDQIPIPSSGSTVFELRVVLFDVDGDNVNADGASNGVGSVSFSVANVAGTSYNAKLGTVTWVSTGVYKVTYTVPSTDVPEQLNVSCSAVVGTKTRTLSLATWAAPFFATTFTSTDRTTLNTLASTVASNLNAQISTRSTDSDMQTLLSRLTLSGIAAACRDISNASPTAGSVGDKINVAAANGGGGGGLSLTDLVTFRNQDNVTAPTVADCLVGGWVGSFARQYTPPTGGTSTVADGYILYFPDASTPIRSFDVTVESSTGEFTGRN